MTFRVNIIFTCIYAVRNLFHIQLKQEIAFWSTTYELKSTSSFNFQYKFLEHAQQKFQEKVH
jgi:hypothetical protein